MTILRIKRRTTGAPGAPSALASAELAYNEVDNTLWYGAGNSGGQATSIRPIGGLGAYVPLTGGTMTGDLTLTGGAPAPTNLILNKLGTGVNYANNIFGSTNGLPHWLLTLGDNTTESGGNAGSNFIVSRYNDAGSVIDAPLSINRASGLTTLRAAQIVGSLNPGLSCYDSIQGFGAGMYAGAGGSLYFSAFDAGAGSHANWATLNASGLNLVGDLSAVNATFTGLLTVTGHHCRAGTTGSYGANYFNFNWNGSAMEGYVDTLKYGVLTVSSDYRIKKDVIDLPGMWDTVKALRPIKYTHRDYTPPSAKKASEPFFRADGVEHWGFIAHELQETMIESAATGVKDQDDCIQSPNQFTLIAALTKALQEAMMRIEALEARR